MIVTHEVHLVILSVAIAIIASYTALDLAGRVTLTQGRARHLWLIGAAIAMGVGIWSMYFIAMLAYRLPIPANHDPLIVLVSMGVAVVAAGAALFVVSRQRMGWSQFLSGSVLMGLGIAAMHYTGMAAMHPEASAQYGPKLVTLSIVIAIATSLAALGLVFHLRVETTLTGSLRKIGGAILMGSAIAGMHYTVMAAISFQTADRPIPQSLHPMNTNLLAMVVGVATLLILVLALLASFFDRQISAEIARREVELRRSEERYRTISELTSDFTYAASVSPDGRWFVEWVTEAFCRITGYMLADIKGPNDWISIIDPDDLPRIKQYYQRLLSGEANECELRVITKDGKVRWVRSYARPQWDKAQQRIIHVLGAVKDITEHKRIEEALGRALKEQELIMEAIMDVFYVLNLNGNLIKWNKRLERVTALSPEELWGRSALAFFPEAEREIIAQAIKRVFENGGAEVEGHLIGEGEVLLPYDWKGATLKDEAGSVIGITGIGRDVRERKRAEAALAKSEAKFRSLIQNSSDIITILEPNGVVRYISPSAERILGYKPEELVSQNAFDFTHPEDVSTLIAHFNDLVNYLGTTLCVEFRFRRKDDSWCFLESTGSNLLNELSVAGIVVNSRDITERKQAERTLQRLNVDLEHQVQERTAQLQQALDFEATLKRITDKVRDSLDENQILQTAVQELALGLGVICCNASVYNHEQDTSTVCNEYTTSTPTYRGRVVQMARFRELYVQLKRGQYFQFCSITPNPIRGRVTMLACPILDNQGVLGDLWLVNQKDYAFKELEIRLVQQVANQCAIAIRQARLFQATQAQVRELEHLNRLKDDFLSTVSHELRSPVSNMKMAIQMLQITPDIDRQQRYFKILQTECDRETVLINDLLDLQRLEAASYPNFILEAVNLQAWLPNIIEPFRSRIQERQQILDVDLPPSLPPMISEAASLGRILAELLNNACKYTPAGGKISLSVYYDAAAPLSSRGANSFVRAKLLSRGDSRITSLIVFVIKNEAEIPITELPRIFDKFYRIPNSDRWRQGGTGLGLALIQKLVEQLQGSIQVDSSEGWTAFTVQLPAQTRA